MRNNGRAGPRFKQRKPKARRNEKQPYVSPHQTSRLSPMRRRMVPHNCLEPGKRRHATTNPKGKRRKDPSNNHLLEKEAAELTHRKANGPHKSERTPLCRPHRRERNPQRGHTAQNKTTEQRKS